MELKRASAGEPGPKKAHCLCVSQSTTADESDRRNGLPRLRRAAAAPAAAAEWLPRPAAPGRHVDDWLRARRRLNERLPRATEGPAARATDDERHATKKTATRPRKSGETTRSPRGSEGRRRLGLAIERERWDIPTIVRTDAPRRTYFSMARL